jgi:endo-1,4-beta-xylanase
MRLLIAGLSSAVVAAGALLSDAALRAEYGEPVALPPLTFLSTAVRAESPSTLRAAAAARGIYIGAAINEACWTNTSEPYATTYLNELNLATCENGCKFGATEPSKGNFDFAECDFISNAALVKGSGAFRGHNFVWGESVPTWVSGSGTALKGVMEDHITKLLTHYDSSPFFECWDVVNEAVCDTHSVRQMHFCGCATRLILTPNRPHSSSHSPQSSFNCSDPSKLWKTNVWTPAGDGVQGGYVEVAFAIAERSVTGKTKLFYNDYAGEAAGTPKSDKIYEMLKDFKARGVPVSGVGLQMHISVTGYPNPWDVAANIKRLGELGLEVHITEMDVRCPAPCDLNLQASIYGNMLRACLNNTFCKSFETWGFTGEFRRAKRAPRRARRGVGFRAVCRFCAHVPPPHLRRALVAEFMEQSKADSHAPAYFRRALQ